MERTKRPVNDPTLRGQSAEAKSVRQVAPETAKLWRKEHRTYDQTKQVVVQVRQALQLSAPHARRRAVDRLDRTEVAQLIEAASQRSSRHGLLVKTLFYTGARVSEFVHMQVPDLFGSLDPPQIYRAHAKGAAMGMRPSCRPLPRNYRRILLGAAATSSRGIAATSTRPATAKLSCMRRPTQARIEKQVTPPRLRASVATILLDTQMMAAAQREMPLGGTRATMESGRVRTKQLAIWMDDARFAAVARPAEAERSTRTALIERWLDTASGALPASIPDRAPR